MTKEITKSNVQELMVKIALDQDHTGTGLEHLRNLATCFQALGAESLEDKFKVIAHFNKNASQYSQNIDRWKNPPEEQDVEVRADAYSEYC